MINKEEIVIYMASIFIGTILGIIAFYLIFWPLKFIVSFLWESIENYLYRKRLEKYYKSDEYKKYLEEQKQFKSCGITLGHGLKMEIKE